MISPSQIRAHLEAGRLKKLVPFGRAVLPVARAALADPAWKTRRNALRVLDHFDDPESIPRIVELLADPHPAVRSWAAHALGCDRCKPGGSVATDPVPHLVEIAENDVDARVRRSAVVILAWNRPPDAGLGAFLAALAERTDDEKLRLHAEGGAERHVGRESRGP